MSFTVGLARQRGRRSPHWQRLACHNPFYAISAALMFYGLRVSFPASGGPGYSIILAAALAAYVVLLTATALFLRRIGTLWEDIRTVALLVVLLLPGVSISFDDTLVANFDLGAALDLGLAAMAILVAEVLFHGLQIRMPMGYRIPYHLLMTLILVFPSLVAAFAGNPHDPRLQWLMFSFAPAAAAVLLMLLPAILAGPEYVSQNGTPWRWPLYPLSIFVVLIVSAVGRTYYLCRSFHFVGDEEGIFAPYFLVPIVFALAVLQIVAAVRNGSRLGVRVGLWLPLLGVLISQVEPTRDPYFAEFLQRYRLATAAMPPLNSLYATALVYAGAMLCGIASARLFLTATLLMIAVIGPESAGLTETTAAMTAPIAAAAWIETLFGVWRRQPRPCLAGIGLTAACIFIEADRHYLPATFIAYHSAAVLLVVASTSFGGFAGRSFRLAAAAMITAATIRSVFTGPTMLFDGVPLVVVECYPLITAPVLLLLGLIYGDRMLPIASATILGGLAVARGVKWYLHWRTVVVGLDAIALGIIAFAVAVAISVYKTRRARASPPGETA